MRCLILFLVFTIPVYCSDFIKEQLYSCVGATLRSALAVGTGYAVGKWFGHEHAGACAGALAVVASKEYPHGTAREMGYCVPIAFVGWYCYSTMSRQIERYKNDAEQRQAKMDTMDSRLLEIGKQLGQVKKQAQKMVLDYCNGIEQIESAPKLPRRSSCPNLALKRANSFGQIAMNELY